MFVDIVRALTREHRRRRRHRVIESESCISTRFGFSEEYTNTHNLDTAPSRGSWNCEESFHSNKLSLNLNLLFIFRVSIRKKEENPYFRAF